MSTLVGPEESQAEKLSRTSRQLVSAQLIELSIGACSNHSQKRAET